MSRKKVYGCWGRPTRGTEQECDEFYEQVYLPLVRAVPHVERIDIMKADPAKSDPAIWRIGGFVFADDEAYERASASTEWKVLYSCAEELLERFGNTITIATGYGN